MYRILILLLLISPIARGQQTAWFEIDREYKSAIELFDKGKYAAASDLFRRVEEKRLVPSTQIENARHISLLKENSQYYLAVCALKLGNQDAENLFLTFIKEYPS